MQTISPPSPAPARVRAPMDRRPRLALVNFSDDFALGTRAIAAYVRAHGYHCDLVFMERHNADRYVLNARHYEALEALLRELAPDVIGLSVSTKVLPFAEIASRRLRAAFPAATLLWGGWHPTMNPERVLEAMEIDGVGVGECEETVLEVLRRVEAGLALDHCRGLWVRRGGRAVPAPQRPMLHDLDAIPVFRYDEWTSYLIDGAGVHPFTALPSAFGPDHYGYALMTSRGCPYSCSFCSVPYLKELYGKSGETRYALRHRSIASVIEELAYAKERLGANFVWFFDEEFLFHRGWVREFLPVYRDRIGLPFYCEFHPDGMRDKALVDLLADAGLRELEIGLQSASQDTLAFFNRPHRMQDLLVELSAHVATKDINVTYDLILDNPAETEADVRTTLDYMLRLARPFRLNMFPLMFRDNYPLTRSALERGIIGPDQLETDVLERRRAETGEPGTQGSVGEFPFVKLDFLNCLIYLTQVDFLPKSWIRRWSRSRWLERHPGALAALVLFLHRTRLANARAITRRARSLLRLALRNPGEALGAVGRYLARPRST